MTSSDPSTADMPPLRIDPTRATTLIENITKIRARVSSAASQSQSPSPALPRLVAVSKLKPATDILALHRPESQTASKDFVAQLHFGENYVQELLEKSKLLPRSVRWHFIGGLQSNKCVQLAREVPGLWAVESVDSVKKANLLNKGRGERKDTSVEQNGDGNENGNADGNESSEDTEKRLRVFVQVNTSGEESKSGVEPKSPDLLNLCKLIHGDECAHLKLQGLMTIGAIARSKATTPENENEDFIALRECRDWVCAEMGLAEGELELSMGMSEDFEGAIRLGSGEVRVGSTIFGERPAKKDAKVVEDGK